LATATAKPKSCAIPAPDVFCKIWSFNVDRYLIVACGLALLAVQEPAIASGTIPLPEVTETLQNHQDCLARLAHAHSEQKMQVSPKTISADGSSREVSFTSATQGVEKATADIARYEGRVWYHHGQKTVDGKQMEVSHSWSEVKLICNGKLLTAGGAQGYTLSTFEPLP
jgi:hypothetical protein